MISEIVYMLCALTSVLCAAMLYRNYRRQRTRLLLWSGICFTGLAVNNILLFTDLVITPHADLSVVRTLPAVLGFGALVWGFVWDTP
jgi:hypothetical protein